MAHYSSRAYLIASSNDSAHRLAHAAAPRPTITPELYWPHKTPTVPCTRPLGALPCELMNNGVERNGKNSFLYQSVADRISDLIERGTLCPGARIPSVRRLSQQFQVSITT